MGSGGHSPAGREDTEAGGWCGAVLTCGLCLRRAVYCDSARFECEGVRQQDRSRTPGALSGPSRHKHTSERIPPSCPHATSMERICSSLPPGPSHTPWLVQTPQAEVSSCSGWTAALSPACANTHTCPWLLSPTQAEASIGDRLQLLDSDRDGVISRQELQAAVSFLKAQLGEGGQCVDLVG